MRPMWRIKLNFGQSGQSGPGFSVRNGNVSVSGHVRAIGVVAAAGSEDGAREFVDFIFRWYRSLGPQDRGKITTERGSSVLNFIRKVRKERGSSVASEEIAEMGVI